MSSKKNHWLLLQVSELGYGQLFSLWMGSTLVFAIAYDVLSYAGTGAHAPTELLQIGNPILRFFDALYYSVITATSTGYGDIVPQGFSKFLASVQSIVSVGLLALVITKLVSLRQDLAMKHVHQFAFEEIFHNIQEELAVQRQSYRRIVAKLDSNTPLEKSDWELITMCLEQGQNVVSNIPDLYDSELELYMLDARRERLLQRSLQRTLHCINEMLDTMATKNIAWFHQEEMVREIESFSHLLEETMGLWRTKSPHACYEPFEDIMLLRSSITMHLQRALDISQK